MSLNHTSRYAELTDEQFLLIGKLTIEFSNIEFLLGQLLNRLLLTPEFLGRTYTDKESVYSLIKKIRNAVDIHNRRYGNTLIVKDRCNDITLILNKIEKPRLLRNKFAHSCWMRQADNKIFGTSFSSRIPIKGKYGKDSIELTNIEIKACYLAAYQIVDELDAILEVLPSLEEDKFLKEKLTYPQ